MSRAATEKKQRMVRSTLREIVQGLAEGDEELSGAMVAARYVQLVRTRSDLAAVNKEIQEVMSTNELRAELLE